MTLSAWRKSNNLSQAEAADRLGLSQGFLSKIERGAQVSLKTAVAISQKTKGAVSVESFIQVETAA